MSSKWVECGKAGRPVGLRGDVTVDFNSGEPWLKKGDEIFAKGGSQYKPYRIEALRKQGRLFVVKFEGMGDRESAEKLRGTVFYSRADALPELKDGHYYSYQILGLNVFTEEGGELGRIVKIFTAGDSDVYEVKDSSGREILIPAIDSVVVSIDIEAKKMTVRLLNEMCNC